MRPLYAGNVGAVARVMKNFGLGDLALIAPRYEDRRAAVARAVHAADILERARIADALEEGVRDCRLVVGTTARGGTYREGSLPPPRAAEELLRHAETGPVALVFGPEDHGLDNHDLRACHALATIETSPSYPSLNLSHAAAIFAYELSRAAERPAGVVQIEHGPPPVPVATMEFVLERLRAALLRIGFLLPENPDHIMLALRRLLGRARPDEREARILLGLARQIEWFARTAARPDGQGASPVTGNGTSAGSRTSSAEG